MKKEKQIIEELKRVVKAYEDRQHFRKATKSRLDKYGIEATPLLKEVKKLEKECKAKIEELTLQLEKGRKLSNLKGVGPLLAGQLIAMLYSKKWKGVRSLRKYTGWVPKEIRGNKYNHKYHSLLRWVGQLQLQHNGPYKKIYEEIREKITKKHPEWLKERRRLKSGELSSRTRVDNAAFLKLMQVFLKDLYLN